MARGFRMADGDAQDRLKALRLHLLQGQADLDEQFNRGLTRQPSVRDGWLSQVPHSQIELADAHIVGQALANAWSKFQIANTSEMLTTAKSLLNLLRSNRARLSELGVASSLYSPAYRLRGAVFHRQGRYVEALRDHDRAYLAALDRRDPWNMAESRAWQAYGLKTQGRLAESLDALRDGVRLTASEDGDRTLLLRGRLLTSAAEVAATLGDCDQGASYLDASGQLLADVPRFNEEFTYVDWLVISGICALRSHRVKPAIETLQQAAMKEPAYSIPRCVIAGTALAKALTAARERDEAIAAAKLTLPSLEAARSLELDRYLLDFIHCDLLATFTGDPTCLGFAAEVSYRLRSREYDADTG